MSEKKLKLAQCLPIPAATHGIPAQKTSTQKLKNFGWGWRNVSPAPPMVGTKYWRWKKLEKSNADHGWGGGNVSPAPPGVF
ncbi:Uncharacterized protein FWK35_00008881 [Aphis craccivora]|uniref:Uncharacterized protein n=1 Tax=Aphis craccivora TaxID=307492 RepID=A0A6G0YR41_APHCR|nr:Uncharacterized protein FWK35_00008881 [Aphis craccivora]